jgi:hypothetical protein
MKGDGSRRAGICVPVMLSPAGSLRKAVLWIWSSTATSSSIARFAARRIKVEAAR